MLFCEKEKPPINAIDCNYLQYFLYFYCEGQHRYITEYHYMTSYMYPTSDHNTYIISQITNHM